MSLLDPPTTSLPNRHRFTVDELFQMVEAGIVTSRVELVHGEILEMAPQGNAHSIAVNDLYDALRVIFPKPWFIRNQSTHRFGEHLAYDPDLTVLESKPVIGAKIDALATLIVEVSDTTLAYDLGQKRLDYARAGVPEYWVADIKNRRIRIFRNPNTNATDPQLAYGSETVAEANDRFGPIAAPDRLVVSDVLPAVGR
jgi:Uma2 family endonuclease